MPSWAHVLKEIAREKDDAGGLSAVDKVRMRYLNEFADHTGRNIIAYYSGFLSKPQRTEGMDINDEDKTGFMTCMHKVDKKKGLDLFLHTPGGSIAAAESLVNYIKQIYGNDVRAFVPQIAMSAGTMMALSCKEIFMGKHSNLGPFDPFINGLSAYAIIKEIETAYAEILADNKRSFIWNPILSRYTPGFVQQCHWGVDRAKAIVSKFLKENMMATHPERDSLVDSIVHKMTDLSDNKGHDKHIHYQECLDLGLTVNSLEAPENKKLQDLTLTLHHCYIYTMSNTGCIKIIENQQDKRFLKMLTPPAPTILLQQPGLPSSNSLILPDSV